MKKIRKVIFLVSVSLAMIISGCAAVGVNNSRGEGISDIREAFMNGDIRLQCELACAGRYGWNRPELKRMYESSAWGELFERVTTIGFANDQAYFYLGRVAEEEGYKKAAIEYYFQALFAQHKCGGSPNVCDGFVFPQDIQSRLKNISVYGQPPSYSQDDAHKVQSKIAEEIRTSYDKSNKRIIFEGPAEFGGACDSVSINAWKTDGERDAKYQIYVMDYYSGELRDYDHASDANGHPLEFTQVSRDVGSCSRGRECSRYGHVRINITRSSLEKNAAKGISVKLGWKGGEEFCSLSSPYVKAILATIPSEENKPVTLQASRPVRADSSADGQSNERRYKRAFVGGKLYCESSYLIARNTYDNQNKVVSVETDSKMRSDVIDCINNQLSKLEGEYKSFLSIQKNKDAKSALADHYTAAVSALKATVPAPGETVESYKTRQENSKSIADQKWASFEITK